MIIENSGLKGIKAELALLDRVSGDLGFVRWQWEYYRATYDYKMEDAKSGEEYFLRINTRAIEGKFEQPHAVIAIEDTYIGRATFPHGLDYESPIPAHIMGSANQKVSELKANLS